MKDIVRIGGNRHGKMAALKKLGDALKKSESKKQLSAADNYFIIMPYDKSFPAGMTMATVGNASGIGCHLEPVPALSYSTKRNVI